jgi:hypothetical protein
VACRAPARAQETPDQRPGPANQAWLATVAAVYVWDYDATLAIAAREVEVARESGALEVLGVGLNILSQAHCIGGDLAGAALLVSEAEAVREATGTLVASYGAVLLAGHRGEEAPAAKLILLRGPACLREAFTEVVDGLFRDVDAERANRGRDGGCIEGGGHVTLPWLR